ncbi:hypothetical protein E2C01_080916 [Portunus trituberculatus]|uniref:Uncharacterized protein n=1 Tax=Portunus trituberculatus TaxID=210409 RepID=A0A5B7IKV8_PORTR|nr:hypothetical protein [Portunus trituberculatus]
MTRSAVPSLTTKLIHPRPLDLTPHYTPPFNTMPGVLSGSAHLVVGVVGQPGPALPDTPGDHHGCHSPVSLAHCESATIDCLALR